MAFLEKMGRRFGVLKYERNRNSKSRITNIKQITMTKIPNAKPVLVIEYWNLRFDILQCFTALGYHNR